jgi:hypothetical protein
MNNTPTTSVEQASNTTPAAPGAGSPKTPATTTLARFVAALAMVPAAAAMAWAVVGDVSTTTNDPDYLYQAPELLQQNPTAVGLVGLVTAMLAAAVLCTKALHPGEEPLWLVSVLSFGAAGFAAGFTGRAVTAGVIGANIGGTFMLLVGPAVVGALALVGVCTFTLAATRPNGSRGALRPR